MVELEVWNKYEYPSYWEYIDTFKSIEDAVKEARLQQYESWRVITVEAES